MSNFFYWKINVCIITKLCDGEVWDGSWHEERWWLCVWGGGVIVLVLDNRQWDEQRWAVRQLKNISVLYVLMILLLLLLVVVSWCRAAASVCLLILLVGLAGLEGRGLESCRHCWLVRAISHSRPALAPATTTTTSSLPGAGRPGCRPGWRPPVARESPDWWQWRPVETRGGQWRAVESSVSSSPGRQCVSLTVTGCHPPPPPPPPLQLRSQHHWGQSELQPGLRKDRQQLHWHLNTCHSASLPLCLPP